MNRKEKLTLLLSIAKSANGKRMSELTDKEQHAVCFLGNAFPASLKDGIPIYDRTAPTYTIACSYIEDRKINTAVGGMCKFSKDTFHIYPDITPAFPETSALEALDKFPEHLLIPFKPVQYETLEPLQSQEKKLIHPKTKVSAMICRVYAALVNGEELEREELAAHLVIHRYKDDFRVLAEALKLTFMVSAILSIEPTSTRRPAGKISYEDTESPMSYLATYLYYAYSGIFIKAKVEM